MLRIVILLLFISGPALAGNILASTSAGGGGTGAPPAIEGTPVAAGFQASATGTCPALTVGFANETIYIASNIGVTGTGTAPTVSSVSSTGPASTSWAVLSSSGGGHAASIFDNAGAASSTVQSAVIYWAKATSAGTYTPAITWSAAADAGSVICWAVSGVADPANPQDTNASLAVRGAGHPAPPSITGFSTTAANTMMLYFRTAYQSATCNGTAGPPAGWATLKFNYNGSGVTNYACGEIDYKIASTPQSGITIAGTNTGIAGASVFTNWLAIGIALAGPSPPSEEFVGPFPNWINAKTGKRVDGTGSTVCTGALGNDSANDTSAIQSCLNILSVSSNPVLWMPPGVYRESDACTTATITPSGTSGSMSGTSDFTDTTFTFTSGDVGKNLRIYSGSALQAWMYTVTALVGSAPVHTVTLNSGAQTGSGAHWILNPPATMTVASNANISVGNYVKGAGVWARQLPSTGIVAGVNVSGISGNQITVTSPIENELSATPVCFGLGLYSREHVAIIGQDPTNTQLAWYGSTGGTMWGIVGVDFSKFSRLTLNGRGLAAIIVDQTFDNVHDYFDSGNEYSDITFENGGIAYRCGIIAGCAESTIERDQFINNTGSGISMENFNALNIFAWYSKFQDNAVGMTNYNGAGNFHAYRDVFSGSTVADIATGNTGVFNYRENYSSGSKAFLIAGGTCSGNSVLLQGNTIVNTTDTLSIDDHETGPLTLIDNFIQSNVGVGAGPVVNSGACGATNLFSMGNTFTATTPVLASNGQPGNVHTYSDTLGATRTSPPPPTLPGTPQSYGRPIREVPPSYTALQTQNEINLCVLVRCVVHLQAGIHYIDTTLVIPANTTMQIIGDGFSSELRWAGSGTGPVMQVLGPSKASLREFYVNGNAYSANAIEFANVDDAGARVYMEQANNTMDYTAISIDGLDYTKAIFHMLFAGYNSNTPASSRPAVVVTGGPLVAAGSWQGGIVDITGGSSSGNFINYNVSAGAHFAVHDLWNDACCSQVRAADVTGPSTFSYAGTDINLVHAGDTAVALNNFSGTAALVNLGTNGYFNITGNGASGKVLALGLTGTAYPFLFDTTTPTPITFEFVNGQTNTNPQLPEQNCCNSTFLGDTLRQLRTEQHLELPIDTGAGITDVRVYRVNTSLSLVGMHLLGPQNIASLGISNTNFRSGSTNSVVGTLTANMNFSPAFSGTYSLSTSAPGCNTTNGVDNPSFVIASNQLKLNGTVGSGAALDYAVCVAATQSGISNSPKGQALTIHGLVAYVGPGDLKAYTHWYGGRGYSSASASTGTEKAFDMSRSDSASCDALISTSGDLGNTANCSNGAYNGINAATWCSTGGLHCDVYKLYDHVGTADVTLGGGALARLSFSSGPSGSKPSLVCNNTTYTATIPATSQQQTLTAVVTRTGQTTSYGSIVGLNGGQELGFENIASTAFVNLGAVDVSMTDSAWHALTGTMGLTSSSGYVDSAAVVTGTSPGASSSTSLAICARPSNLSMIGGIAEIGLADSVFSGADAAATNSQAHSYWGF